MEHGLPPRAHDVLEFWFGPAPHRPRDEWFRKDPAFDASIREQFGDDIGAALAGAFGEWCTMPRGAVARVILLDQFTRNIFRDTPRAFAGDAAALATSIDAVAHSFDRALGHYERWFLYMPFMHAEDAAMQERSLTVFGALAEEMDDPGPLEWAEKHAAVIQRFGRYPHRNTLLGRESTPAEIAFLAQPGSRF